MVYDVKSGDGRRQEMREKMWATEWRDMDPQTRERTLRIHAGFDRAMAGDQSMYVVAKDEKHRYDDRGYILPFGRDYKRWNPRHVNSAPFGREWLSGMHALICERLDEPRSRPTRLIFTSGQPLSAHDRIGVTFVARHDQTNKRLGDYRIAGVVVYDPWGFVGRIVGMVPDVAFACSTYK